MTVLPDLQQHRDFAIAIADDEIARLLGYGDHPIPARVRAMLTELREECLPLVKTAWSIRRVGPERLSDSAFLGELGDVVLCLVTIGHGIEKLVEDYDSAGEMGRALMANVYGSAAAEAAADAANAHIREMVEQTGLFCSRRFSPGYNGWDVAEQRWLLPVLEGEQLGVTLTAGCMMVPRKSVTFAVSVGDVPLEMRDSNECDSNECDSCDLANCRYRRKTPVEAENGKKWQMSVDPESSFCPRHRWG